jgi:hypothetical protein
MTLRRRTFAVAVAASLAVAGLAAPVAGAAPPSTLRDDFNGDGYRDLATTDFGYPVVEGRKFADVFAR